MRQSDLSRGNEVVALLRDVFRDDLIGVYLHGSAVLGTLRPFSDLDVLAVTRRRMSAEQRRRLGDELLERSGAAGRISPPAPRPIELTVVVQPDVRPWRYPPRIEFQYGEWLRAAYESGSPPAAGAAPDLTILLATVLLGDRSLFGPPPSETLDPIPMRDIRRAARDVVAEWMASVESDQRNVLLALARIWMTLETREIASKDVAAAWALSRLPPEDRAALAKARSIYLTGDLTGWDDVRGLVRKEADSMVALINSVGDASAGDQSGLNRT